MPHAPLQTFIIYARADEAHKNELLRHLKGTLIASGDLRVWQDGNLLPGEDWEKSIKRNLEKSDLVLVLVSSDSLGSDFINTEELRMALEQRAEGRSTVVPIILRSCLWMSHPILRGLQGLPKNMKPVKSYADADEAWTEVLEGLERILLEIREKNELPKEKSPAPALPTAKVITPKLEIPEPQLLIRDCPDCPEMVFVKGGTFMMGSEDGEDDEKPVHQVTLSDFYIGKYPVTFEEYDRFCEATKRPKPSDQGWGRDRRPVINVSWHNADDYCDWLSALTGRQYRLPTEAEWEFAARGGVKSKERKFSGSNDLTGVGWYGNPFGKSRPVGEKAANELGLYDMSGNVWELCNDWYDKKYYEIRPPKGISENPKGPEKGGYKVLRGGSYQDFRNTCRVARRWSRTQDHKESEMGFRLVRDY